jgi:thiamine monophosphate synthase
VVDKLNIPVYFLGGMRIKDLEKTRKLGAQGIGPQHRVFCLIVAFH